MSTYDVAVIGAGIAGCAVAMECAGRGARVALLDRGQPGSGASGAAAGMLAPGSEADAPGAFFDAARSSLGMWPDLAATASEFSGIDCGLVESGLVRIAQDAGDAAALQDRIGWQRAAGVSVDWLDEAGVLDAEPACSSAGHGGALYDEAGHVDSPAAVRAFAAAAKRLGATVLEGSEVVGATRDGALRLAGDSHIRGETVVVAAGAWSGLVANALGLHAPPSVPMRGQLIMLRGVQRLPRMVLYGGRLGYALARHDATLVVGATEEDAGFDVRVTVAATEKLLTTARQLVSGAGAATLTGSRVGLRPTTADHLPVLGELGWLGSVRVLIASGHHRNGVLLAPLTATMMAQLVLDGTAPPGLEAFDPRRFG